LLLPITQHPCIFIRVANLSPKAIASQLRRLFASFGEADAADIDYDKLNGRPKCTAMADMPIETQAKPAIKSLDRTMIFGRMIRVVRSDSIETW
jgi:RNA recognition motif-containing protein